MNVLVVTWDGGGNRQPFEVVVDALVARGDTVRIISNEVHRDLYGSLGASFVSLDVADKDPATRSDLETQIGQREGGDVLAADFPDRFAERRGR